MQLKIHVVQIHPESVKCTGMNQRMNLYEKCMEYF